MPNVSKARASARRAVKATPKAAPKRARANSTNWTQSRIERLVKLYAKANGKRGAFETIAQKLGTTRNAVYNKLGRMGQLQADWSRKHG